MAKFMALASIAFGAGFVVWFFAESLKVRQVPGWAVIKAIRNRRLKRVGDKWVPYDRETQTEKEREQ